MTFRIYLKDPDGVIDGLKEAAMDSLNSIDNLSQEEKEVLLEGRIEKLNAVISKWFRYGEAVTLEIDSENEKIRVVANE